MWPIKNVEKCFMAHQYMPKIFYGPYKNPLAPPSYILNVRSLNWTNIRRSEDALVVFWTSYVRSIYILCPRSKDIKSYYQCCVSLPWMHLIKWKLKLKFPSLYPKEHIRRGRNKYQSKRELSQITKNCGKMIIICYQIVFNRKHLGGKTECN